MKKDETTGRLDEILRNVHSDRDAKSYIEEHGEEIMEETFSSRFNSYVAAEGLDISKIIRLSGINKNYVYNILNGHKHPGRDKIIALCIAAGMNAPETGRTLKISGYSPLYSKDERDIRITICINNGMNNVTDVNIYLDSHGVKPLNV